MPAAALRTSPNLTTAFHQVCRRYPDRVAIRDRGESVTYRQLGRRVEEIAAGLAETLGPPPPGTVIAVLAEPGMDAVSALLATLATGSAYLPLDVDAPDDYLSQLVDDARPAAVIVHRPRFHQLGGTLLDIGELADRGRNRRAPARGAAAGPTDPAYMIFTSGSTGRAKGVLLPHTAMLHSTAARVDAYGLPGRVPLLHSAAVDVHSGVLFWTLLTGATLVIGPGGLRDVPATAALLDEESITDLVYLSSLYPALLDYLALDAPGALRRVMIGSERWSDTVVDRHSGQLPQVSLHNEYGPSESAVWTSQACVWDAATRRRAPMTIGQPVTGTRYRLLNPDRLPTATGERGELYITGAQLALGYRGAPDLTAERFVTLTAGERAYRTGDLVEISAEGDFVFAGRVDRQITVHGNRIEPGQVEAVLMRHPCVGFAHVMARADTGPGTVLAAYLTAHSGGPHPDADEVRAFAAGHLPTSMLPTAWAVLDTVPRNPVGKVDEAALPAPIARALGEQGVPLDTLEMKLAALAGEILTCPPPAVTTRLTDAGASSLALMQLAARIARDHQVIVSSTVLFAAPTVREIAAYVRSALPTDRPPLIPVAHDPAGTPLSWQQQQIWILSQLAPTSLAYHTQCSLQLTGDLNVAALEQALSHVVARHEILRSTFHDRGGDPVQAVHEPWPVLLECVDLSALPAPERDTALHRHFTEQTSVAFATDRLPLVRWHLYRLAEQQWTLLQVEHHFVHDGWSANLLLAEIRDAYGAYACGRTPEAEALPVQYRDWAAWQRAWKDSEDYASQRAYWQRQLEGVPTDGVTFCPDLPRPAAQSFDGACLRADVPADTLDALDAVCAAQGITRFGLFLTAFALLVRLHTGEDDMVIGSALANRRQAQTEPLLGMFVNALPLRLRMSSGDTVADTARRVMDVVLGAQDHQEFPLVEILNDLRLPRDPAQNPLFQLMFAFHDTSRPTFDTAGVRGRLHIEHNGSAKNDMNVIVVPHPPADGSTRTHDGAGILWEYGRNLFTPDSARALLESYGRILTALADPLLWDQPTAAFDILDPAGALHVTRSAHGPALAPRHPTLHAGVDAQAAATPGAVALVHGERRVTYQDLDGAAAGLETELDDLGISPGARVVVACGPGPEHVAACLAVLRRGAAYVCLDPHEPAARLRRLLADARPAALICSRRTAGLTELTGSAVPLIIAGQDASPPATRPRPLTVPGDALAYLVYTSGSTGDPKAVMASHTNAVTALEARTGRNGPGPARTLITLPLSFDVASSMIFFTLWNGGTVVFPDQEDPRDPAAVRDLITSQEITHVNFVASYYRHFLTALSKDWTSTLHTVAIGGEPCPPAVVAEHAARIPSAVLDNEYGPTEASVWCAAARVHEPSRRPHTGPVTIGRPLPGYELYVVNEQLRPRPAGARGELCVAGPGVAAGYLGRPELTRQHFVTPEAGPLAGVRLLRTGDRGRLRADGTFEVIGRLDEQVKIRGFRVELGEVRQCLQAHPAVTAAHLAADHGTDPAGRLTAWVAAPHAGPELPLVLHDWAAQHLPASMVPADIVVLDELPVTATGKVDPAALPRPRPETATSTADPRPADPAELAIVLVWRALLGRTDIGADDTWFALGGDSLTAIRAVASLREHGISIDVAQFLQATTVRQQAALIARSMRNPAPEAEVARRPGGTVLALTPIQAWFADQDFANPHHFNQGRLFAVPADIPAQALETALTRVTRRHDAFRTRFTQGPGGWSARLDDTALAAVLAEHTVDASAVGPDPRLLDELHQHLNLHDGPLWAAALFTDVRRGRRWLALVAHHLIVDAVSWDILARDLALAISRPDQQLPPAPGIFTTFQVPVGPEAAHWRHLAAADKPVLAHPPGQRAPYNNLTHHDCALSAHATTHLLSLAQRGRATLPSLLLAALHRALARLTHGSGLYTLIEGHGRTEQASADQIVGWLTSLHPVLLTGANDPEHLLATAARFDQQLAEVPRAGIGYAVARYLHPDSELGKLLAADTPPEITFNYLGQHAALAHGPVEGVQMLPAPAGQTIADMNALPTALHVTAAVHGPQLRLHVSADPGRFDPGVIEAAISRICNELEDTACLEPLTTTPLTAGRPHFLIHPVDGQVHWYEPLANALTAHGWASYGLRGDPSPADSTIPALADRYVKRIRRIQPTGPYTLTGWSFGAAVAYEMARLFEAEGQRVQRLLLLDPPPLPIPSPSTALAEQLAVLLPDRSARQREQAAQATAAEPPTGQLTRLAELLNLTWDTDSFVLERLGILLRHHRALSAWEPQGRIADLHLVQPTATASHHLDRWLAHGQATRRSVVPGDHHSMLRGDAAVQLASLYSSAAGRTA